MRERSQDSRGSASNSKSKSKRSRNILENEAFRISKINLTSGGDLRLTNSQFRKSMLLEPTSLALDKPLPSSQARLQQSVSSAAIRVKAALAFTKDK